MGVKPLMKIGVEGVRTVCRGADPGAGVVGLEATAGVPGTLRLWTEREGISGEFRRGGPAQNVPMCDLTSVPAARAAMSESCENQVSDAPTKPFEPNSPRQP